QRDPGPANRLRRERTRPCADKPQSRQLRLDAVGEGERATRAETAPPHTEAREPDHVDGAAAVGASERHAEAAARVDRSAPPVGEANALELREGGDEVAGQRLESLRPLVEVRAEAVAKGVDGVVTAPEDPVVARQPVVVELIAGVGGPLPVLPPD